MSAPLAAPVELHDAVALRFDNGAIGTLSGASHHMGAGGFIYPKYPMEVRAIGSTGQVHVDMERETVWRYRSPNDDVRLDIPPDDGRYDCVGPINTLVDLALGRDIENCSPIEVGARTVEILHAAYRSARSGVVEQVQPR